jgi:hypothetical protein
MTSFRHPTSGRYTRLKTGVGEDGRSRAFAKPGEKTLAVHHSPQEDEGREHRTGRPANELGSRGHAVGVVRDGKSIYPKPMVDIQPRYGAPKMHHPASIHNGMTRTQIASAGGEFAVPGLSHPSSTGGAALASGGGAVPVDPQYGSIPKSGHGPAPLAWNMKKMGISYEDLRSLGKTLQPKVSK